MNKKKAIKIATATVIAASAFTAVAPAQSEAATSLDKQITKAKSTMKKPYDRYAKSTSKLAAVNSVEKDIKAAKKAQKDANAAIKKAKLSKKQKDVKYAQIKAYNKYITRAENYVAGYNNATHARTELNQLVAELNKVLAKKDVAAIEKQIATLNEAIAVTKKEIKDTVYGAKIETLLYNRFTKGAETAVASAQKELAALKADGEYAATLKAVTEKVDAYVAATAELKTQAQVDAAKEAEKAAKDAIISTELKDADKAELQAKIDAADKKVTAAEEILAIPAVESVNAVNAKELVITFNKPLTESSVIASGDVKAGVLVINNGEANALTSSATLSKDGKTLTLVSSSAWDGSYSIELKAEQAKTVDDKFVAAYKSFFTADDTARAEVTGVTSVDKYTYDINFSEPVQSTGTLSYAYTDGSTTEVKVTSATLSDDKKSVRVVLDAATLVNKEITVSLPSVTDFADNVSKPTTAKITVSDADKVKPAVASISTTGYDGAKTSFQIKLSEAVKGGSVTGITVNGSSVTAAVDTDDKTVINATVAGKIKGSVLVYVPANAVTDLNDNGNAEVGSFYTFTQDETAPTVVSQSVERIDGVEHLILTFNEEVNTLTAPASLTFKSVNEYGMSEDAVITSPATAKHNVVDGKTKQIKVSLAGLANNKSYKVTFASGLVKDAFNNSSAELKDVSVSTSTVDTGVGITNVATIGTTPADPGKITVTFSKPVNVESAQNVANYQVEDATVTKAEVTSNNSTGATVVLTLSDDTVETTGNYNVTVKPITTFNALDKANVQTTASVTLKENVRPVLSSSVLTNLTADALEAKLTFNDTTVTNGAQNDFELYVNGEATGQLIDLAELDTPVAGTLVASWTDAASVADLTTATSIKLVPTSTIDVKDATGNIVKLGDIVIK